MAGAYGFHEELFNIDSLEEWARAHPKEEIIGTARISMYCPVAEYVKEITEEAAIIVVDEAFIRIEDEQYESPIEIQCVVNGVDDLHELEASVDAGTLVTIIETAKARRG